MTPTEGNCRTPPRALASAAVGAKCPISWQNLASKAVYDPGLYPNSKGGLLKYVSGVFARYKASIYTLSTVVHEKR